MSTKTTCGEHRVTGYAYRWTNGRSTLACRACGLPDSQHETIAETVKRLASESTITFDNEGK